MSSSATDRPMRLDHLAPSDPLDAVLDPAQPIKRWAATWSEANLATPPPGAALRDPSWFDDGGWSRAADAGLLGLLVEPAQGGRGRSILDSLLVFEGLGRGTAAHGTVFALASQVFAMQRAFTENATQAQGDRWLPGLLDGTIRGAFAMSEPEAGSDTASIATTMTSTGDGSWELSGTKTWVTMGPMADLVIVFATADPTLGRWGLSAFLVDTARAGVHRSEIIAKSGLAGCPFGSITFDRCQVTADDLLGGEGAGATVFARAVEAERSFLYAAQVGSMERTLATVIERARTRRQSGTHIGSFQAVSHRIAEMQLRWETARLLVYKAAARHQQGQSVTMAAALAKLGASEAAVASAIDAVQVFGASGYTVDAGVETDLRDALGGLAYSGTSDIQRNIVASLLGLDRPARDRPGTPSDAIDLRDSVVSSSDD